MITFFRRLCSSVNQLPLLISISLNAVLTAALLYAVLPLLDLSFNTSKLTSKVNEIATITDADVYNLWQVHVAANDRHFVMAYVRDEADRATVEEFGRQASSLPFSKVIPGSGVTMLLGGNPICDNIANVLAPTPITQQLRTAIKAKHVCFIPIKSARNELIGYLAMIWKTEQTDEHMLSQVTLARGELQANSPWD
jgi:hypothetical protein